MATDRSLPVVIDNFSVRSLQYDNVTLFDYGVLEQTLSIDNQYNAYAGQFSGYENVEVSDQRWASVEPNNLLNEDHAVFHWERKEAQGSWVDSSAERREQQFANYYTAPHEEPSITGLPIQGNELAAITDSAPGVPDGSGLIALRYQWLRDNTEINGATQSSYTLTQEDVGKEITVAVSYIYGDGTVETVTSDPSASISAESMPSNVTFDIELAATFGNSATFEVYATQAADSGNLGLDDVEYFSLSFDLDDITVDDASVDTAGGFELLNTGASSTTRYFWWDASTLPAVTGLTMPFLTFDAIILNDETPFTVAIDEVLTGNFTLENAEQEFELTSIKILPSVTDHVGNSLSGSRIHAYDGSGVAKQVFLRHVSTSSDSSVFEIVANPEEVVSYVEFYLTDHKGLTDLQVGEALNGWLTGTNTRTPADFFRFQAYGAVDGAQDLVIGQETVLATFETSIDPDFAINRIVLNETNQAAISVSEVSPLFEMGVPLTEIGNVIVDRVTQGSDVYLNGDKHVDENSAGAITANDALQALRLAVGLDKSDGTAEWHDYIAADINKDGQVSANDALNILKLAVGLNDADPADWVFVDSNADYSAIDRKNTDYDEGVSLENVVIDTSVDMMGILVGDVNGSYVS